MLAQQLQISQTTILNGAGGRYVPVNLMKYSKACQTDLVLLMIF